MCISSRFSLHDVQGILSLGAGADTAKVRASLVSQATGEDKTVFTSNVTFSGKHEIQTF